MTADATASAALCTPRLRLVPHGPAFATAREAMAALPAVYRFTGGRAATAEETWHRVLRYAGHWACFGFGPFAVLDRADGAFVGEVGAMDFRRGIPGPFGARPEMGWAFVPDVHGTGMAGEAIRAVLAWMDAGAGAAGTVCMIQPANTASLRLAARIGYRRTGAADYHGARVDLFARPAGATFDPAPC